MSESCVKEKRANSLSEVSLAWANSRHLSPKNGFIATVFSDLIVKVEPSSSIISRVEDGGRHREVPPTPPWRCPGRSSWAQKFFGSQDFFTFPQTETDSTHTCTQTPSLTFSIQDIWCFGTVGKTTSSSATHKFQCILLCTFSSAVRNSYRNSYTYLFNCSLSHYAHKKEIEKVIVACHINNVSFICPGERMLQQLRQQRWWIYFNDGICWGNCFWEENNENNIARGTTDLESTTWVISIAMFATLQHTLFNSCKIRSLGGTTCTCRKFAHQPGGHQVPKLATRSRAFHCHIALNCLIAIISWYWVGIFIS